MKNTSGRKPLGHAVLCIPYEPELSKSIIFIPPTAAERSQMVETRAIVVEAGPLAWDDEPEPRAVPGDKVLIGAMSGKIIHGADGKKYRIVNDGDIYCKLTEE